MWDRGRRSGPPSEGESAGAHLGQLLLALLLGQELSGRLRRLCRLPRSLLLCSLRGCSGGGSGVSSGLGLSL